jgi:hypothetical protein
MPRRKLNGLWIILEGEEDDVPNLTQEEDWGDNVPDLEQEDTFNNVIKEGNSPNVFLCDQCEFATSKECYLHLHKKQKIHSAGNFVCDICGTMFIALRDLETHQEKLHQVYRM